MSLRILLPLAVAFSLIGCSGGSGQESATKETPAPAAGTGLKPVEGTLKVALLTPGPVSDSGWSAMAFEGLQAIKSELGAEVNNQEATGTQIKDAMRTYSQKGYNLIFGHGFEYNEPAIEVGKDFPSTAFVSSSGGSTAANVGAFRFYLEQGFYLAGLLAGTQSKSGVVAMVGGPDVPSIRSTFKAFRAGAIAAKPNIKVEEVFTGSDKDIALAKQATLSVIAKGADFVIHQANASAQGVFDACKEKGVFAFGANADQNSNESGAVIASAVIVAKPAFVELAKQVKDGSFKGGIVLMGMDKGTIDFIFNPALASKVDAAAKKAVDDAKAKILSGELVVPKDEF